MQIYPLLFNDLYNKQTKMSTKTLVIYIIAKVQEDLRSCKVFSAKKALRKKWKTLCTFWKPLCSPLFFKSSLEIKSEKS